MNRRGGVLPAAVAGIAAFVVVGTAGGMWAQPADDHGLTVRGTSGTVAVSAGPCARPGGPVWITRSTGTVTFDRIDPGSYCVRWGTGGAARAADVELGDHGTEIDLSDPEVAR